MSAVIEEVAATARDDFEAVRATAQPGAGEEPVPPDMSRLVARRGGAALARCTVAVADALHGVAGRSGLIGHYEAVDPVAGAELLAAARARLAAEGVARVLAPMNGSTWERYRLALPDDAGAAARGAADPDWFLGEPRNPFDYPAHFAAAGFSVAARYESRVEALAAAAPADVALATRLAATGLTVAPLDLARFDRTLEELFDLSLRAFADNLYYAPLPFAPFRAAYDRVRPLVDPALLQIARAADGSLAGFLFAYGDPLRAARGGRPRVIVKTVATAPEHRGHGLGQHMLDRARQAARERGFGERIHALMHVDNPSMRMSARHESRVFRRYALYEWTP